MAHWVGGIDKVPGGSLPILSETKRSLDMYADVPQMRGDDELLLSAPNMKVESLGNILGIGVVGFFRPEIAP